MNYTKKRSILSRITPFLLERSQGNVCLKIDGRIHESDFKRSNLSKEKYKKGKFEYVYTYYIHPRDSISKGQEFDVIFSNNEPLNFFECKTKILEIYEGRSGEEKLYAQDYHNDCLVEFIDGVPDDWDKVAYVPSDYAAPKRMEYTFTTKETMFRILELYKIYQLFEKLEEESSDNIILAIDSIATNEYYKLPENLLQKENNAFVCIEGVRAMEVNKDTEFDVVFTLDAILSFIECKTRIVHFYTEDGDIINSIPKNTHSWEACHLEFENSLPDIWKKLCLNTDGEEIKQQSEVLYLTSNQTMLRLLELLEKKGT